MNGKHFIPAHQPTLSDDFSSYLRLKFKFKRLPKSLP